MNNVVAIIDSGINTKIIPEKHIVGGTAFTYNSESDSVIETTNFSDDNGHGTICAQAILRVNPNAKLYIIKILNQNKLSHSKALIAALNKLKNIDVKFINISLTSSNPTYHKQIEKMCKDLYKQNKILLSSCDNRNKDNNYPAILKTVIGVAGVNTSGIDVFYFDKTQEIQFGAYNKHLAFKSINNTYELHCGNSIACAFATGIASKISETKNNNTFTEMCRTLEKYADTRLVTGAFNHKVVVKKYDQEILNQLIDVLMTTFNIDDKKTLFLYPLISKENNFMFHKFNSLVENLIQTFNINFDIDNFRIDVLTSIETLYDYVLYSRTL